MKLFLPEIQESLKVVSNAYLSLLEREIGVQKFQEEMASIPLDEVGQTNFGGSYTLNCRELEQSF